MTSQLCRAAISVSSNIAEGSGSGSHALFARYLAIATASATEVEALLRAGGDAELIDGAAMAPLLKETGEIRAMLIALHKRVSSEAKSARPSRRRA